jgi:hypothetical protein
LIAWLDRIGNGVIWELDATLSIHERGVAITLALQTLGDGTPRETLVQRDDVDHRDLAALDRLIDLGLVDEDGYPVLTGEGQ